VSDILDETTTLIDHDHHQGESTTHTSRLLLLDLGVKPTLTEHAPVHQEERPINIFLVPPLEERPTDTFPIDHLHLVELRLVDIHPSTTRNH
jgi:hypothetical protein